MLHAFLKTSWKFTCSRFSWTATVWEIPWVCIEIGPGAIWCPFVTCNIVTMVEFLNTLWSLCGLQERSFHCWNFLNKMHWPSIAPLSNHWTLDHRRGQVHGPSTVQRFGIDCERGSMDYACTMMFIDCHKKKNMKRKWCAWHFKSPNRTTVIGVLQNTTSGHCGYTTLTTLEPEVRMMVGLCKLSQIKSIPSKPSCQHSCNLRSCKCCNLSSCKR